jgi:DNA-binding NtrC family response regulator
MPPVALNPVRLLLVDDDSAQLRLLARILEKNLPEHIHLEALSDPTQALARVETGGIDILVSDLVMSKVGGLELLNAIKDRNRCSQVLLMTAYSTADVLLQAMEAGAVDYLLKPVAAEALVELVLQSDQRLRRWREALAGTFKLSRRDRAQVS